MEDNMKTLFIVIDTESPYYFFEKEGDYRHLDGNEVDYVYGIDEYDELYNLIEDLDKHEILKEPAKDWDFFVTVYDNG